MVVSNEKATERIEFFNRLSKYKKVDSGGRFMNNIGGAVASKMNFIRDYKFVISFENSASPGYTTEKLIEPMLVNSIPIYWGNSVVGKDFNTDSFLNIADTNSFDEAIEKIINLDKDHDKYLALAAQPWFHNNEVPTEMTKESLVNFLDFVIADSRSKKPVANRLTKSFPHGLILFSNRIRNSISHRLGIERRLR